MSEILGNSALGVAVVALVLMLAAMVRLDVSKSTALPEKLMTAALYLMVAAIVLVFAWFMVANYPL